MTKNINPAGAASWGRVLNKDNEWSLAHWVRQMHDIICYEHIGNPWDLLIDIGPGVPNSEAWIFREYGNIEILGFEPQHERYNFLKDIYPGRLSKVAVTGHTGTLNGKMGFPDGESDFKINLVDDDIPTEYKEASVDCITVDDILAKSDKYNVFVWADIEGGEFDMLRGCINSMLFKRINFICLELNFARDALAIIEFLRRFSYFPIGTSSHATQMEDLGGDFSVATSHVISDDDVTANLR